MNREPNQNPESFKTGERVRIYLGYSSDTEIHIREGIVLGHSKNRRWRSGNSGNEGPCLELKVERTGVLERQEPREVKILNRAGGNYVSGRIKTEQVKPYSAQYFYHCISGAETL